MKTGFSALGFLSVVSVVLQVSAASGPSLVADYDRDGAIDESDYDRMAKGDAFTVWLNDDDDDDGAEADEGKGDTNTDLHDVPGGDDNDKDCEDDKVNGRCDLLDFFPVLVDVGGVPEWDDYDWKLSSHSVNIVFTKLTADTAGSFHTKDVKDLDGETPLYEATVSKLAGADGEEAEFPDDFLGKETGKGIILIEGAALAEDGGITLRGTKDDSDHVEVTMNLAVKNVEDMYGWMNLRGSKPSTSQPLNLSTSQLDARHFILVHGDNTNHEEARGNAAEFYKKLWQSGFDGMFTAVEWHGDRSQVDVFGTAFSPNRYANVENAFAAASAFKESCAKLKGELVLVGHGLGNVLISSAIKDCGLDYTKYVMLNASVAREAYDAAAYDEAMVPEGWRGAGGDDLTGRLDRAARWYRNFADKKYDPYEYRRKLAWRGRFADLPRTVNYYSSSDEALRNPSWPDDPNDLSDEAAEDGSAVMELLGRLVSDGGFWAFSEKSKGRPLLIARINDVMTNYCGMAESDVLSCEGGWGTNANYDAEAEVFDPSNTRFTPFLDERMTEPGMLDVLPAETERLRPRHLADAIPAESFAAGANPVATLENVDLEGFIGENDGWPLHETGDQEPGIGERVNVWRHSAFREVAFYHTSGFYASLAAVGKPRVIIDTDLGSSMDDLFTIDLAARMHREGKLDLMALMINRPDNSDEEGGGEFLKFADRYLATLGLGDLPIGKSMPLTPDRIPQHVFNPYWTLIYSNNVTGAGLLMPTNRTDAQIGALTDAVSLYRRLLAGAPDKSVVICSTGFLNNLKALMDSGAYYGGDDIGSTGLELIAAKVEELRIMAGCFDYEIAPDDKGGAEYNAAGDPAGTKKVFEEWPTPVIVSTWEVGLDLEYDPDDVLADFPPGTFDPIVRAAYTYWPNVSGYYVNRLWDVMTLLPLTEGKTLAPLSEMGGISVDEKGVTTFTPDPSSNRCYQVASNMNATAVMNRLREIYRTGNPSVSLLVSGKPEPGVDYNGSELVFRFTDIRYGRYAEEDLRFNFAVGGVDYAPESTEWDEALGVLSVRFVIPPDAVTAGNEYDGTFTVSLENAELGENIMYTGMCTLVQGRVAREEDPTDWFYEVELATPTNYMPATAMPERCLAAVEATVAFAGQTFVVEYLSPANAVQGAVRIVEDGADGYKFQYFACVGKTNENSFVRGWWDFNVGGEDVSEIKPVQGKEYTVRAEAYYFEDARGEENTLVIWVEEVGSNRGSVKQFIGNIINKNGGHGGTTRLDSVGFTGEGDISSLFGYYYANTVNANLARIDGDDGDGDEYATVAEAVAAADGEPIRLLHAASWSPTEADIGKPVGFLNKSLLHLDISGLPANARAVWTDEDGNAGTLTLELVSADTVVYGTIRTAEEGNPVAEAIAVKDGKYVYVGDESGAEAFIKDGVTEVVDHRGRGMVMPGCTDGHSHYVIDFAKENMVGGVRLSAHDDKTTVLRKLETAALAAQAAGKQSLYGFGWNFFVLMLDTPTLAELDAATHGVSTVILDQGGHHAFCNTECLKKCGILSDDGEVLIKEIDGGHLELDENGYPTGYAEERVTGYLMRMGGIDYDDLIDDEVAEIAVRKTQELLLSTGYTTALEGWSNMLHPSKFYEAAHRIDTKGELKIVFPMTYEVEPWQTDMTGEIDCLASLKEAYGTRHVLPEYLKVFMDGVVETRTGATIKPYKPLWDGDEALVYRSFWTTNRLADITRAANAQGLTVHVHAMGDAAVRDTVDACIQGGDGTHRNCIVHLRDVTANDFQRIAANNIACSAGMTWHVPLGDEEEPMRMFLEPEYVDHAYPIKSFFDVGVKVSSHSDYPANGDCPQDPFGIMETAVTGLIPNSPEGENPYDPSELITVEQAFQALTINGAWQLGLENERGSIKVGKWADFVLADQDVFECAATDIGKTTVLSTWFEGEKVYEASVPVTPGVPVVFDTAEDATNGMEQAVITPSAEIAEMFGADAEARSAYCAMFELYVGATTDGKWAVGAFLKPGHWTNVVESAQDATLQLPVGRIAEWQSGDDPISALLTNCVPGFYYSLFDGAAVTNIRAVQIEEDLNVLCGTDKKVVISEVTKPIGGQNSGFFTIGVKETSGVNPGSERILVPPVPHPGPGRVNDED